MTVSKKKRIGPKKEKGGLGEKRVRYLHEQTRPLPGEKKKTKKEHRSITMGGRTRKKGFANRGKKVVKILWGEKSKEGRFLLREGGRRGGGGVLFR